MARQGVRIRPIPRIEAETLTDGGQNDTWKFVH